MTKLMTTWRSEVSKEMKSYNESFLDVVSCTLTEMELDRRFDSGYCDLEGCSFTIWTEKRVYFPACYDGSEWCASVARNPDGKTTKHVGGG